MITKLNLILGFHGHLHSCSLKNNDSELLKNYLSLIKLVSDFPQVKSTIHFSGQLFTYLDKKSPDFSLQVRNLLDKNQLELLGGGIYNPIFPLIPKEDRQTQLLLMTRLLDHTYGYIPAGAWVTECVWEPSITYDLAKSKIEYTYLLKDYFLNAGLAENDISGYYITEEEGRKVAIFPISESLNTLIDERSPKEAFCSLLKKGECLSLNNPLVVLFYEGPFTNINQINWLKEFFQELEKNTNLIETKLSHEYFVSNKPLGRIYLGSMHTLQSGKLKRPWKRCLLQYPEANLLHKKMLRISKKINAAKEGKSRFKVIKAMINQAQELLLKGQSSNTYWNSTWGGICIPEERHNTYSNLIEAENLIDMASRQGSKWIQLSEIDYDCDGNDEIIIESETQNIYLSPALGGTILEHDFKPKNINIINTMSNNNGSLKSNLIDHFLASINNIEKLDLSKLPHLTKDIILAYTVEKIKAKEETCKITLKATINLERLDCKPQIELIKQISTRSGDSYLTVDYTLTNKSTSKIDFLFAVEFNFNITSLTDNKNSYFYLDGNPVNKTSSPNLRSFEKINNVNQISVHHKNEAIDLTLSWSKQCNLLRFPIETTFYNNENKEELIYQGTTVLPLWQVYLEPELSWDLSIKQNLQIVGNDFSV